MMSKKQSVKSSVYQYFNLTADEKYYVCQCTNDDEEKICGQKISSFRGLDKNAPTRTTNLLRHLSRYHQQISSEIKKKDKEHEMGKEIHKHSSTSTGAQSSIASFFTTDKITITMTAETFKKHLIDLVVENGLPLSIFSQPAFMGLNGEMAKKFGISLDRENIRKLILDEATSRKQCLKDDLKGQFIYLKMDAATRHRVNYFAINARFINKDRIIITKTLAVKDTEAHHDSHYLQKLIEGILNEFEIKKEHILCIITDNASNMIKTIELLNEEEQEDLNEALDDVTEEASKFFQIKQMRCAVHTLQLAIRDGLKEPHAANLISKFRQAAISARTPKIDAILRRRAGKGAIIDQTTRWGSTYLMLKRLLELKNVLEDVDNPSVSLTERQWNELSELESLLATPFITTKNLQSEDLTGGMFLREWKNLIFVLSKKGGLIAEGIVSSMKKRENTLLNNDILLSSVYVDPKHRVLLDDEQIKKAKKSLYELSLRIKLLSEPLGKPNQQSQTSEADIEIEAASSSSKKEINFDEYLDNIEKARAKRIKLEKQEPVDIEKKIYKQNFNNSLEEIERYDRSTKTPLLELIQIYPEKIKELALLVTALPPTQVSVERLFSSLKFIKSDLRSSIKEDLAEAILFLRNNK